MSRVACCSAKSGGTKCVLRTSDRPSEPFFLQWGGSDGAHMARLGVRSSRFEAACVAVGMLPPGAVRLGRGQHNVLAVTYDPYGCLDDEDPDVGGACMCVHI